MIIFKYSLINGLKSKAALAVNCILPLVLILIRPLWTGDLQLGFNLVAFMIMGGTFVISQGIMDDRTSGTVVRILAAPVTMFSYLMQKLFAYTVPLVVNIIVVCLVGYFLYDWSLYFAMALMLCYTVLTLACVALTFAWACLFKSKSNSLSAFSIVLTAMAMLGGLIIPIDLLPDVLQHVGAIFPSYWASNGIESLIQYGITGQYWLSIAVMLLFTAIFLLYGGKRRII